jgi:serine/threonine-protein kinase RsbW
METVLKRTITNELHSLESLMNASTNFLEDHGIDAQAVYRTNLGLEEMITNIIKHGYDDYETHNIEVAIEILASEIAVTIEDDGHKFDPLAHKQNLEEIPLENRQIGGLGIHLIRTMLSEMTYKRESERNVLTFRTKRGLPTA